MLAEVAAYLVVAPIAVILVAGVGMVWRWRRRPAGVEVADRKVAD